MLGYAFIVDRQLDQDEVGSRGYVEGEAEGKIVGSDSWALVLVCGRGEGDCIPCWTRKGERRTGFSTVHVFHSTMRVEKVIYEFCEFCKPDFVLFDMMPFGDWSISMARYAVLKTGMQVSDKLSPVLRLGLPRPDFGRPRRYLGVPWDVDASTARWAEEEKSVTHCYRQ